MSQADFTYMSLVRPLLTALDNNKRDNRTDTQTGAIFGAVLRFDLEKEFPILTSKQVHFPSVVSELLWFLKGDTNIKYLLEHNNHIWTDWRLKEFNQYRKEMGEEPIDQKRFEQCILDSPAFAKAWGSIGKGYGHQWRNFGESTQTNPTNVKVNGELELQHIPVVEGFDQISWVINEIKTNPTSRRLIVSGWNPHEVNQVDLPPCHTLFQFFVQDGKLSCQLYQRSADYFLGVPFNIASYALLTHLIARECGLGVGMFNWVGGDVHLYENHRDAILQQENNLLNLNIFDAPQLVIGSDKSIFDLEPNDIALINYQHAGKIPAPVAV